MRAATEMGINTVAIYSQEDRYALHRYKADESYLVGKGKGPIDAYLDIDDIVRIAREALVDAIHPGYGFLSENSKFADIVTKHGIKFVGPSSKLIGEMGDKIQAKIIAKKKEKSDGKSRRFPVYHRGSQRSYWY